MLPGAKQVGHKTELWCVRCVLVAPTFEPLNRCGR